GDGSAAVSRETSVRVSVTALPPPGRRSIGPQWSSTALHCARWHRRKRDSTENTSPRPSPTSPSPTVRSTHRSHDRGRCLQQPSTKQADVDLGHTEPIERGTCPLDLLRCR